MDATASQIAVRRGAGPVQIGRAAIEILLAAVVLVLWAWAFVGFDASGYWTDELFTLFVADPSQGLAEVVRRALTDTNPPAYYIVIHYWMRLFGDGEAAARSFSALCAVGAGALLAGFNRDVFSRPARLFGVAAGASSFHWFKQSQNLRSYALAMLIMTALLNCAVAARRQNQAGRPVNWGLCAGIAALGLLGAFVHHYLFLAVGVLYLALLVGVPDLRLRTTVLVSGCVIAASVLLYVRVERSHLPFSQTWFSNDPEALAGAAQNAWDIGLDVWAKRAILVLLVGMLYGLWRRTGATAASRTRGAARPLDRRGLIVRPARRLPQRPSRVPFLVAPSLSARNLLVAAPCVWFLVAWVFDRALESTPRTGLLFAGLASVLVALGLLP